ncbi:hypothetical protein MM817_02427 [Acidibacillus sp. S0AB]|uniref:DUF2268 domain-containing protein n=1 Tax=Sulfoacidibacillus ferrooxidans TaxID=2005001 RepID=A0A9X1VDJ9_9BACL|nr:hypothetical protein [Sulfoacidibacillus ferrooxidans]
MKPIEFIPRLHQMKEFIEACEMESASERRHLFMSLFNLTDEDVNYLIFHGMIPLDSPLDVFRSTLKQMDFHNVEPFIQKTLIDLSNQYPSGKKVLVELYPMDKHDKFGRERLGGVSAWTNWEGDTIHLVVYPARETEHALESTVVHEYNHHYRITALNNGHADVTLLEKIVREGLAEHFVAEVLGVDFRGPWVDALSEDEAKRLWDTVYSVHSSDTGEETNSFVFGG